MAAGGRPVTVHDLQTCKREGRRFAVVTAYDYTTARILDAAGIPVLLVGNSLGGLMLGYSSTLPVTMEEMLHHARSVARGAPARLLVGDMPFGAYHASDAEAVHNAAAFLKAGMNAVKVEGGGRVVGLVAHLVERGIPVMGHLGLTPSSSTPSAGCGCRAAAVTTAGASSTTRSPSRRRAPSRWCSRGCRGTWEPS